LNMVFDPYRVLAKNTNDQPANSLEWIVTTLDLSLADSNVFFLAIDGETDDFTSHYINMTTGSGQSSSSITQITTQTSSPSPSPSSSSITQIATQTSSPSPSPSPSSSSSSLSPGAIAGIATGSVSAVFAALGFLLKLYKWKHPKKAIIATRR
jgi:hypothetical protein